MLVNTVIVEKLEIDGTVKTFTMEADKKADKKYDLWIALADEYDDPREGPFHFLDRRYAERFSREFGECPARRVGKTRFSRLNDCYEFRTSWQGIPTKMNWLSYYALSLPEYAVPEEIRITYPMRQEHEYQKEVIRDDQKKCFVIYLKCSSRLGSFNFDLFCQFGQKDKQLFEQAEYQERLITHYWMKIEPYKKAEIALSSPSYDRTFKTAVTRNRIRILSILGGDKGIDIDKDRQLLAKIDAETTFLVKRNRQELNEQLWSEQGWDILCFSGHSSSEMDSSTGYIDINDTDKLSIPDLKNALSTAIERGLQIAIFNSCDGLGLANQLAQLHIPQIIVFREPVPDVVAQEFLKNFLTAFASGKSFYLAVREARERLQSLENHFPCASWLPVICQNPAEVPPTWRSLQNP
jgi:hypothetical protein